MAMYSLINREVKRSIQGLGPWLFLLLVLGIYVFVLDAGQATTEQVDPDTTVLYLQPTFAVLIPFGALILSHRCVSGELATGRMKLTAAMPHSRRDILLSKWLAIGSVIAMMITIAIVVVTTYAIFTAGVPRLDRLVAFVIVSLSLVFAFVGIGVVISVMARRPVRATVVMIVALAAFLQSQYIVTELYRRIRGSSADTATLVEEPLIVFLRRIDPIGAFYVITNWTYDVGNFAGPFFESSDSSDSLVSGRPVVIDAFFDGSIPTYLTEPVSVIVLIGWIVVPIATAIWVFNRVSLS